MLQAALDHEDSNDLVVLIQDVGFLQMQARMHGDTFQPGSAVASLKTARDLQGRVLGRVGAEQPEAMKQQQQVAAGTRRRGWRLGTGCGSGVTSTKQSAKCVLRVQYCALPWRNTTRSKPTWIKP